MFGKNEIVGKKFFKEAPFQSLFVTSMFMTLQGEGPFRGQPAFFIRLAKCNLACSFCDTYFDSGDWMTYLEIDALIEKTIADYFSGDVPEYAQFELGEKCREMVLVITGGEPMLQEDLGYFTKLMGGQFRNVQIESNGTLLQEISNHTTLVVSPKCAEKDGKATKYLKPNNEVLSRASCLKFVMSSDQDSPYSEIPQWAHDWYNGYEGGAIFISPMNIYNRQPEASKIIRMHKQGEINMDERSKIDEVISFWEPGLLDMKANQRNHEYAARYCIQWGYTFNMQQHLFASLA